MTTPIDRLATALADRYRIERELGQGGMATVYLAHDVRHDRDVAVKVLHEDLGATLGPERFLAEIKTTAKLQHPHILPLLDSGEAGGLLFYVMPFVAGETLRERLTRETQLPIDDAVRLAREIADALGAAHTHGIIHRDIKPENILLQGGHALVADFGIALAVQHAGGQRMTQTGLSLGTPQYMSPEQAMGDKTVDHRADIYALGAVTYEMLTGDPPFTGSSIQAIVAKVVSAEPERPTLVRRTIPPSVEAAVLTALAKLPADRFESARAFADALGTASLAHRAGAAASANPIGVRHHVNRVTVGLAAIAAVLAILLGATSLSRRGQTARATPVVRFSLADDPSLRIEGGTTRPFAISPDGRTIVFRASTDSTNRQLWLRTIDDPRARPLEGTTDGANPAISPDGNWVAFVVGNVSLRKVRITGADATVIAQLDGVAGALSWASNDEIVFEQISPDDGIHRINASGGRPELLIPIDTAAGEARQRRPLVLRDAGVVAYASYTDAGDEPTLVLYRLSDGRRARLGLGGNGALAMIDDNRLVYARRDGTLMVVPIDARGMKVTGSPVAVTPRVASARTGNAVGLSEGGTLVYRTADARGAAHLDLMDTSGTVRRVGGELAVSGTPRFSPDGRRIVVEVGAAPLGSRVAGFLTSDLWTIDLATGEPTRVTAGSVAAAPSWSPDGKRLVYLAAADSAFELWSAAVDGSVSPSRVASVKGLFVTTSMMPDGRSVVVQAQASRAIARGAGLLRIWIDGSERVDTVIGPSRAGVRPEAPRVSPDGRWVSFIDRTTSDVWVRSLSGPTMMQVTTSGTGDNSAVWGRDSRHLFHTNATLRGSAGDRFRDGMVAIDLQTEPALAVIRRRALRGLPPNDGYDLSPDGKTFVVVSPVRATTGIIAVVNWADDARRQLRGAGAP